MSTSDTAPERTQSLRRQAALRYRKGVSGLPGGGGSGENSMRNRRTAVLGGSGFIGRYIVKRLAARGEVIPVGCRNAEEAKFLKPMGDVGQIATLNVSIGDERLLPAFLAGNDSLVNCVGTLRESRSQTFEVAHHTGPGRLAGFAREAGVEHFFHISAIGADPRSTSAYAKTKAAGE